MIKIEVQEMKEIQLIARQYPNFVGFIKRWKDSEFETLCDAVDNPGIAQGRCRVLKELNDTLSKAPGWTV